MEHKLDAKQLAMFRIAFNVYVDMDTDLVGTIIFRCKFGSRKSHSF